MIENSFIYTGEVIHKRFKPKEHFFKYRVFSLLIDLSEIRLINKKIPFFSYNKFNLLSFFDKDHGERDGSDLGIWVRKKLKEKGITSEDIKIKIGSAFPDDDFDKTTLEVRGLHLLSGLPRSVTLTSGEIREAMAETLSKIVEAVKRTLERTPPELAADIVDRGIMLAGGGALVRGINDLLSDETGIFTHIAEDPLLCVVNGCGEVLDDFKKLKRVVDTPDFIRNAIRD